MPLLKRIFQCRVCRGIFALLVASLIWLPNVCLLFDQSEANYISHEKNAPKAMQIANRYINFWTDPRLREIELEKMRSRNAEWDFMGRCFFVWSLANMALREPELAAGVLPVMDFIIDETIKLEEKHGMNFFLMPYARLQPFIEQPPRSIFIDGEISLMMALRRLVSEKEEYRDLFRARIVQMYEQMNRGEALCGESYPDECWLFCNSVALAAMKISDYLDGTDHSEFFRRWVETAKAKLIDDKTGILVSSFNLKGDKVFDGPEGSTIWLATHCLKIIDPEFAKEQYAKARLQLKAQMAGFGYAYEWPGGSGRDDVDSGPILPIINLSAGSTGLAFVGAASFDDRKFLSLLHRSLEMGAFPVRTKDGIRYCASNAVGDAVLLYSITLGPAWEKVMKGRHP